MWPDVRLGACQVALLSVGRGVGEAVRLDRRDPDRSQRSIVCVHGRVGLADFAIDVPELAPYRRCLPGCAHRLEHGAGRGSLGDAAGQVTLLAQHPAKQQSGVGRLDSW